MGNSVSLPVFGPKQNVDIKEPSTINALNRTSSARQKLKHCIFRNSTGSKDNPNEEIDRLHSQHYLYRYAWEQISKFKSNFSAPVRERLIDGISVLDVGCGPGTWLLDMASTYPQSNFMGIDLFPQFPSEIKPNNCDFLTIDFLEGLPFDDGKFDFVHMRFINHVFTQKEWNERVIKELIRLTKPGGFLELMDVHVPHKDLPPKANLLSNILIAEMDRTNIWWDVTSHFESLLSAQQGLEGVTSQKKEHTLGVKGAQDGILFLEFYTQFMKIVYPQISKRTNIEPEEFYNEFMPKAIEEFNAKEYSPRIVSERVFAQKTA
ncbi:7403_t:CDS:2 [Ambispora gerdemannii]|uniref:7403_t:CDS:1 n=1 Tax=Ambispora gerdemannii TaxID=144530 RepID=A0A9N8YNE5_9GLOM|nr:7403_t:CDS:2 [Ambispora gerdemannii]